MYVVKVSQDQIRESIRSSAAAEVWSVQEEIDRVLEARIKTWDEFIRREKVTNAVERSNRFFREGEGLMKEIGEAWKDQERKSSLAEGSVDMDLMADLRETVEKMSDFNDGIRIFRQVILTNSFGGIVAESGMSEEYAQATTDWWKQAKDRGSDLSSVRGEREE